MVRGWSIFARIRSTVTGESGCGSCVGRCLGLSTSCAGFTWLTGAGIESAGLSGVRPVKSPPGATTIAHGVLVGWSAARVEHRGRLWKSARELAVERDRRAVRARCERGYTELLPDLAVWLKRSGAPVAVIAESGGRREDRQKMILEGWRDGIVSGCYAAVHYHCANEAVEHWIRRLARKVGLTGLGSPQPYS